MTGQLPLPFELRDDYRLDTFVPGPNAHICARLAALAGPDSGAEGAMLWLYGASGCGKTHLLQGQVAAFSAANLAVAYLPAGRIEPVDVALVLEGMEQYLVLCIDDVDCWLGDAAVERELVRLYQERRHAGLHLLLSAKQAPASYEMAVADWRSRAQGAEVFRLEVLDENDKLQVLVARATRLGLTLGDAEGTYLLRHGPRGLPQMLDVLKRADRLALAEQRRLTVPLLRAVLQGSAE